METFTITRDVTRKIKRFSLQGRTLEFKINTVPEDADAIGWTRKAINSAITFVTENLSANDQVGVSICSNGFARGEGWLQFREASKINTDDIWNVLSSLFQSNSMGLSTDTFCLGVTSVQMPSGKGQHNLYSTFVEECAKRRGIVVINNRDNLCLPRALVVGMANITRDSVYKDVRQDTRKEQTRRAQKLVEETGVVIPEDGCGILELQQFQRYLKDFKITVYQYGGKGRDVVFQGAKSVKNINLIYHKGHYNVITSLTAAFCCSYFCDECHAPFESKQKHLCNKRCFACQQSPPCFRRKKIKCSECFRSFYGEHCFENHQRQGPGGASSICRIIRQCPECLKTIKADIKHICGEIYCKICRKHVHQSHHCYMSSDQGKPKLKDFVLIFYDLETMQEKELDGGALLHEPNLCILKMCCEHCMHSIHTKCVTCGDRVRISSDLNHNRLNKPPIEWFLNIILRIRQKVQTVVVVAHNGQAFDHQFLLHHVLTKTDLTPELLMRGTKLIQMKIGNVKFIDSLNYFPMALAKLPKAFGLGNDFKKGYFPHLFNTLRNQNYVGILPPIEYYSPDTMMGTDDNDEDERKLFLKWYNNHKNDVFNFAKEMVEYCISDVEILTEACLKFRNDLLEKSNVDPFMEACTIASACNKVYRRNFLEPNTIGIIPKGGYRWRDNQSKIAVQWLVWEEKQQKIEITHAAKGRESIIGGLKVDGYCEKTKQVFEFHGCYYHGCPNCLKYNRNTPLHDDPTLTLNLRFESTEAKTMRLRELGYDVIEMWECDFRSSLSLDSKKKIYCEDHHLVTAVPLNPRDAFYGGRTGNCCTYYECKPGEKIRYVDICSLYPWVCKYGVYPIKHPSVYVDEDCSKLQLADTEGLIKCSISPPKELYHPVLPTKMNEKLMFLLCRSCGERLNNDECEHSDNERALTGTWVINEVRKAIEKGYQLVKIHEMWVYKVTQYDPETKLGGLFTQMMNTFIQIKQQASGWPGDLATVEERDEYIEEFFNKEGIRLNFAEIKNNAGLRALAKLMLNSFWGKLGQRENQPKTAIVNNPDDFFTLLTDPALIVNTVLPVNENVIVVNYTYKEEASEVLSTVNVALAAYTTAQARLKLYSFLEIVDRRVLYYDTDSIIYISRNGEKDIPVGSFLGDMTDELTVYGAGSYITRFVSGGPKNYAYEVFSTDEKCLKTTAKVKGIRVDYKTSKQINFGSIADTILHNLEPFTIASTNIRRDNNHQVLTKVNTKTYRPNSVKRQFNGTFSVPYGFIKRRLID